VRVSLFGIKFSQRVKITLSQADFDRIDKMTGGKFHVTQIVEILQAFAKTVTG
jgi:hypothetical protein